MNKLFTYLLALCTATCLYGCSEELEEMTSTEESPSNIVSRSIPESFSCGTIEQTHRHGISILLAFLITIAFIP